MPRASVDLDSCPPRTLVPGAGARLAVVLVALGLGVGCTDDSTTKLALGEPCDPERPSECGEKLCIALDSGSGFCSKSCAADGKCPSGFHCEDTGKHGLICVRPKACEADNDCPSGHRCDGASGQCYIKVARQLCSPCTLDLQCPAGGGCFTVPATGERYCTTACGASGACPEGYACEEVPFYVVGDGESRLELRKQCIPDNLHSTCEGGKGLCSPCAGDQECGGYDDLCVENHVSGEKFCSQACDPTRAGDCPPGFTCGDSGAERSAFQCLPNSNTCAGYCDSASEKVQTQQCGMGRECDLDLNLCKGASDGRQCSPCLDNDDCRKPGHEWNECIRNNCSDCEHRGETFCAEPCPETGGDPVCVQRFGPGFVCARVGESNFCVPQGGSCTSGLGRLGDSCAAEGAEDCVTGLCLSYGSQALCSQRCAADAECGDPLKYHCCALSGDFYDCSQPLGSSGGVCAPTGGLFGDDCSPGRPPCQSGTCLNIGTAMLCTVPCGEGGACPTDFVCRDAFADEGAGSTPIRICFPDGGGEPGSDCTFGPASCAEGLCIKRDSGPTCTVSCAGGKACPEDWECKEGVKMVQTLGTGTGQPQVFARTLVGLPVIPGTIQISDGNVTITDDGAGKLTGPVDPSGANTVDYATGALNVKFTAEANAEVKVTYQERIFACIPQDLL